MRVTRPAGCSQPAPSGWRCLRSGDRAAKAASCGPGPPAQAAAVSQQDSQNSNGSRSGSEN
eukprot:CAMPEP_0115748692 /NCGR_PEP_ID=MMETSP0272-20121206/93805_1 /TAXON_ID=71861 /ORGANISM="Scrippsiella trochoidea, Strain CCMP3099" /LENGTH=60 /DNA_ID=CAMNT_0003193715 /DNA_START=409 /DNA_END=591 /DNA_ORIENTATION=-